MGTVGIGITAIGFGTAATASFRSPNIVPDRKTAALANPSCLNSIRHVRASPEPVSAIDLMAPQFSNNYAHKRTKPHKMKKQLDGNATETKKQSGHALERRKKRHNDKNDHCPTSFKWSAFSRGEMLVTVIDAISCVRSLQLFRSDVNSTHNTTSLHSEF